MRFCAEVSYRSNCKSCLETGSKESAAASTTAPPVSGEIASYLEIVQDFFLFGANRVQRESARLIIGIKLCIALSF